MPALPGLPRMVATDLDGTLLRADGEIDERTRRVLALLADAGVVVVFVSGRPPRWMHQVAQATGHTGLAICGNGAVLYDLHAETILEQRLIPTGTLHRTAERLTEAFPGMAFAVEYGNTFAHEPLYVHDYELGVPDVLIAPWPQILDRPAIKLLACVDSMDPDTVLAKATEIVGDLVTVTHSSLRALLEMSALGVTKATALSDLAARHGIEPGEVLAFGDMPNDLAMLAWAGRAVAVANAHPEVRAGADEITASNDESGVAVYLERMLAAAAQQQP